MSLIIMPLYVPVPCNKKDLHEQTELADVTDEEFKAFFEPKRPQGWIRAYRIFCFFFFLGPIRILIAISCVGIFYVVIWVMVKFESYFASPSDMQKWLRRVLYPCNRCFLGAIGMIRISVKGELDPNTRTIVCNHLTPFDAICVFTVFSCEYLAMASLSKVKLFQLLSKVFPIIWVDRSKAGGVTGQLIAEQEKDSSAPICVFPEGKITNGDCILGFRTGSFVAKKQTQAITMRFKHWLMPKEMATVSWNEDKLWLYVFQLFSIPFLTLEMTVLPPLKFDENATPSDRAREVQLQMANYLGCLAVKRTNKEIFQPGADVKPKSNQE